MKVVITGVSGFIGTHLIKRFKRENLEVIGVSRKDNLNVDNLVKSYKEVVELKNIDLLIHMADTNLNNNIDFIETSYVNKKLAAHFKNKIIFISSALVYGENTYDLFNEKHIPKPLTQYAKNKYEYEKDIIKFNGTVLRLANVYGKGMSQNNVFYDIYGQIKNNNSKIKIKNIKHIRDFIAVDDVCDSILAVALKQKKGTYNICTGKGTSIEDLANIIIKNFGLEDLQYSLLSQNLTHSKLVLNPTYTNTIYNWKSKININNGCKNLLI